VSANPFFCAVIPAICRPDIRCGHTSDFFRAGEKRCRLQTAATHRHVVPAYCSTANVREHSETTTATSTENFSQMVHIWQRPAFSDLKFFLIGFSNETMFAFQTLVAVITLT